MNKTNDKLVSLLFETKAIRICPERKPFWYTSGTIGPYYINTHFLYGSEEKANDLLKLIDEEKSNSIDCPQNLLKVIDENYNNDRIFNELIDEICTFIKHEIDLDEVDFISGGERRDWFFSLIIANLLNKPHISIYKDSTAVVTYNNNTEVLNDLNGSKVLHIADLITEASSYKRTWIPAIKNRNGEIKWSVVVVDRKQGGKELLQNEGVKSFSMINIDKELFDKVLSMGLINKNQYDMVLNYIDNPKESMKKFLLDNPDFLECALNSDQRTKERARLCLDNNVYGI